jgi:peptide/nickel transport system substrate-binding protein
VKIKSGEYAALEPDMLSGNCDATLMSRGYLVDVADPGGYLVSDWTCGGGYNIAHYCNSETEQLITDAVAIEDAAARSEAYAEIAEKLQSEAASVFLLHEARRLGHSGRRRQLPAPPAGPVRPHRRPRPRRKLTRRSKNR